MKEPAAWDAAFDAVVAARRHLMQQKAQNPRVNKRRDQIDARLLDCEQAIAWLICMANDEAGACASQPE